MQAANCLPVCACILKDRQPNGDRKSAHFYVGWLCVDAVCQLERLRSDFTRSAANEKRVGILQTCVA